MLGSEEKWKGSHLLLETVTRREHSIYSSNKALKGRHTTDKNIKVGNSARTPRLSAMPTSLHGFPSSSPRLCRGHKPWQGLCWRLANFDLKLLLRTQPWATFQLWRQNRNSWQTPSSLRPLELQEWQKPMGFTPFHQPMWFPSTRHCRVPSPSFTWTG